MSRYLNTPAVPVPRPPGESPFSPSRASDQRGARWLWHDRLLRGAVVVCAFVFSYELAVTLLRPTWGSASIAWLRAALAWPILLIVAYVSHWLSHARRPEAMSWWMLSAGALASAIARTLWTVEDQFIFRHGVPFPGIADLVFLLQYPFVFLAIILVPQRSWGSHLIMILDGLLFMGAATALSWSFLLAPLFTQSGLSPLAKAVSLAYPVGDLFLLFAFAMILLRPLRYEMDRPVVGIFVLALACIILADSWAAGLILQPGHVYRTGEVPNLFRFASYLLVLLAALVQLRLAQHTSLWNGGVSAHRPKRQGVPWDDLGAGLRLFLPIGAALLASVVILLHATLSEADAGWRGLLAPIVVGLSLLLLVILRQAVYFLEIIRLRRENEAARAKEQALLELNRRKDEFLGVVSHEIRTPLTSLQGYIQLLARRFDAWRPQEDGVAETTGVAQTVARTRAMLGYCLESLRRLTRLADDLVDDVRIRDGRLTLRRALCDLVAIVRAAVEEQRVLEPDRIVIWESPPTGSVPVVADADRIAQVVTNYLTNALKYSKEDRPVVVRLEVEGEAYGERTAGGLEPGLAGGLARVLVRDDGPGLSLAEQAHVWERFPRIAGVAVQSGSGVSLGIGLHISRTIVEAHGGRVGVASAPGQGATFWFTLPLAPCTS